MNIYSNIFENGANLMLSPDCQNEDKI